MILTPHIIVGAVIGAKIKKPFLIIILGFLSHFILDAIVHWDYPMRLSNVLIDVLIGILIVFLVARKKNILNRHYVPYIILGIFASLLPDFLWWINAFVNNELLNNYTDLHHGIHYLNEKEGVITFLGLFSQVVVVIISLLLLFVF